MFSLTGIRD